MCYYPNELVLEDGSHKLWWIVLLNTTFHRINALPMHAPTNFVLFMNDTFMISAISGVYIWMISEASKNYHLQLIEWSNEKKHQGVTVHLIRGLESGDTLDVYSLQRSHYQSSNMLHPVKLCCIISYFSTLKSSVYEKYYLKI